ncbi:MAG: ABC transporter permease [Actinomycetes bacterium]
MSASTDVTPAGPPVAPQAPVARAIEGRSLGQIAWAHLRRDTVAITGAVIVVLLILVALLAPVLTHLLGQNPNTFHTELLNQNTSLPDGPFGGASWTHPLGVEPTNGRDILARIIYGARVSLVIALAATAVSLVIGVVLGITAGYFGGWLDTIISRFMDLMLAFPVLLFSIALLTIISGKTSMFGIGGAGLRISVLILVIGIFSFAYVGRIIRGQTLSLRNKEFVEAARSMGARSGYVLVRELLPNLVAPILVYATLTIPTNILTEAGLSFLGVGVQPPTASWGQMLSDATNYYQIDPMYMVVPGIAIFITVLAFNLFGDGLRDALDPRSQR